MMNKHLLRQSLLREKKKKINPSLILALSASYAVLAAPVYNTTNIANKSYGAQKPNLKGLKTIRNRLEGADVNRLATGVQTCI
jgi:hypothetical protein